ncbi:hypothetical protein C8J57DRAFT_1458500 [Mycena rebaudengoi]|nr:hypothetical protein C8J57DRAFT_1458500 [Mycena rebaudengoi]
MTLSGILELPTEILARIFEDPTFPTHSLYYLSLLSRRLHFVTLPIFFARNNTDYASGAVIIAMSGGSWDMLTALQSALFISAMEDITCVLPHLSCTSIAPFLFHLERVKRLIARFPSCGEQVPFGRKRQDTARMASTFGDLLNYMVDRKCVSLTILHGGHFTRTYELSQSASSQSLSRRLIAPIKHILRSELPDDKSEFRRVPQQGREWIVVPAPMPSTHLTALHIQSVVLLVPPCLNWTLGVLRHCPITTLTISKVNELDFRVWNAVLPLIASAAQNVAILALTDLALPQKDLIMFCIRFPRITHLELSARFAYTTTDAYSVRIPRFRHLISLKAPPEFLAHCLQSKERFPKLQAVSVLCRPFESPQWDTDAAGIALKLASLILGFKRRLLAPVLSLSMERTFAPISADLPSHPNLSDELRQHLDRVVGLELWTMFPSQFEETGKIGRWISVFRQVERVAITIHGPIADEAARIALIVQAMSPTNFMQTVEVNGRIYDLAGTVP